MGHGVWRPCWHDLIFDKGGNWSNQKKPSKLQRDWLKLSSYRMTVEVGVEIDDRCPNLTAQEVQH
mgnify:CR=1 FL=1